MKGLTYAQKFCIAHAGKAMQELNMVEAGSKVGVAVSGGVDSFTLLEVMWYRQKIVPFHFDFMAIHINPGFDKESHLPLKSFLSKHGIAGHLEIANHGLLAHSDQNHRKSPCFLCAMLRRTRLFEICKKYGLTHLAFGHNANDLASTFFMNLVQNGRVDGLMAKDSFFCGKLIVIRPLITIEKEMIVKAAEQWKLPFWKNSCPSAGTTNRTKFEQTINILTNQNKFLHKNVYHALEKWQMAQSAPRSI